MTPNRIRLLQSAMVAFMADSDALTRQLQAASDELAAELAAATDEDAKDKLRASSHQIDNALNQLASLSIDSFVDAVTGA